jgi:Tfp pilus assembly protein PilO
MKLQRKTILVAVFGLLLLAYAGDWARSLVMAPLDNLRRKQASLKKDVENRRQELAQARQAAKELADWERQSLPSDPQIARSVYQAWLLQLVSRVGLSNPSVDSTQPGARGGYYSITFSLQARGTLEKWTRWLYEFYRAGHLHQIRSLSITPIGKKEQLDVMLSIEALVLPGADRPDRLSDETSDRLAFERLEDYRPIVLRNLFSLSGSADPMDQTYLTGIHHLNGRPEAWFTLRGEADPDRAVIKLRAGQDLAVGQFHGTVLEITDDDVILESGGERWLLAIGEHLGQAFALPPEF